MTDADTEAGRGGREHGGRETMREVEAMTDAAIAEHVSEEAHNQRRKGREWMADRLDEAARRLRQSDPGVPDVRRLSDGSIPDTAHWEDYYDYAAFVEDGTLVIETGAAKEGSICCSDPDALRIIYALLWRELTDERATPTDEAPEGHTDRVFVLPAPKSVQGKDYQAKCTCGWRSGRFVTKSVVERQRDEHLRDARRLEEEGERGEREFLTDSELGAILRRHIEIGYSRSPALKYPMCVGLEASALMRSVNDAPRTPTPEADDERE